MHGIADRLVSVGCGERRPSHPVRDPRAEGRPDALLASRLLRLSGLPDVTFTNREIDAFAEALAEGKSVPAAAKAAGYTASFGKALLDRLCEIVGLRQAR